MVLIDHTLLARVLYMSNARELGVAMYILKDVHQQLDTFVKLYDIFSPYDLSVSGKLSPMGETLSFPHVLARCQSRYADLWEWVPTVSPIISTLATARVSPEIRARLAALSYNDVRALDKSVRWAIADLINVLART